MKNILKKLACAMLLGSSLLVSLFFTNTTLNATSSSFADEIAEQTTKFSAVTDGVGLYAIKISSNQTPVIGEGSTYFPSDYTVKEDAYGAMTDSQKLMFVVNNGDTVFLADDEYLLFAFGRTNLTGKEAVFTSIKNVGGACNITHFVDGEPSTIYQRFEELSEDGNNYLYQYGHIFNTSEVGFQEGNHEFVFDYGTVSESGDVELGKTREFNFYLFKKDTYNKNNDTSNGAKDVILTPDTRFTTESAQGFVSNDMYYYNEYFFNYSNKTMNVNKLTYPKFVFDPAKVQVKIEKTYNKQTFNATLDSEYESGVVNSVQNAETKIVRVSKLSESGQTYTQVEFCDVGEYKISYEYVYFTADGIKQVLPNLAGSFLQDKITVFGYQLFYSKDYTSRAEFREITIVEEDEFAPVEDTSYAADITYAISNKYVKGGDNTTFINAINSYPKENVVSTNQSPLKFDFAGTLDVSQSVFWQLNSWSDFSSTTPIDYDGSNFLSPGKYVVEVFYNYSKFKDSGTKMYDEETVHSQLLIFEITNSMPIVTIETLKTDENGDLFLDINGHYERDKVLQDGEFTNDPARVVFPTVGFFDSLIRITIDNNTPITIQPSSNDDVTYSDTIIINAGEYKNTTVVVEFGKGFSSSSIKSFTTDKVGISNVKGSLLNSQRIKVGDLNVDTFIINQSFSIEWDEKLSGSKTWATYKFVPLSADTSYLLNKPIVSGGEKTAVANGRYLEYATSSGAALVLAQTPYTNTISSSYAVTANSVLATEGLYIFRIYDQAGNETYYYMVLDKSTPIFLQKEKTSDSPEEFAYVTPKALNVVSNTTIVEWGTHKAIALGLFSDSLSSWRPYAYGQTTGIDPWVLIFQQSIYDKGLITTADMKREDNVSVSVDFLSVPITGARVFTNKDIETEQNPYLSSSFRANVFGDDGEENEADYTFFIVDASNISANTVNSTTNQTPFFSSTKSALKTIASSSFSLSTTTDMALSTVFISDGSSNSLIMKEGGVSDKINYLNKTVFYKASNALQLRFSFNEDIGNNILANVKFYFYPMIFNQEKKTLEYSTSSVELYEGSHYRKVLVDGQYIYILQIPIDSADNVGESLQGKYVIERTYETADANLISQAAAETYVVSKKDYVKRTFTAYIDHNDIITTPDAYGTGESIIQIKEVGDFWKLTATDSTYFSDDPDDNGKVIFKDFFRQDANNNPVVKTNKNPIEISVPYSMYGTKYLSTFSSGMNHGYTYGSLSNPEIAEFFLSVTLQRLVSTGAGAVSSDVSNGFISYNKTTGALEVNIDSIAGASEFLQFDYETGFWKIVIPSGDEYIGIYRVIVSNGLADSKISNNFDLENSSFEFVVQVISPTPTVLFNATVPYPNGDEVVSIQNQRVGTQNIGYTNGENIVASWTDPVDDFIIKIDTAKVSYTINDGPKTYVTPDTTGTNGVNHSVVAKKYDTLGSEISFANGDVIVMYFGVVGRDESEYVYTKTIIVDITAPTTNLSKLIQADRLVIATAQATKEQILRVSGDRYNRSTTVGNYKYYSFALDVESSFTFEMGLVGQTSRLYFKSYNDKYTSVLHERTLPGDPSQSSQSNRFLPINYTYISSNSSLKTIFGNGVAGGEYFEIVEADIAGNYTIYSIFLYSSLLGTNTLSSTSSMNPTINIAAVNASERIVRSRDVLQINEINLCSDDWYSFELLGKTYFTSPFVNEQRANSFMTMNSSGYAEYKTLAEISTLFVPSLTDYTLSLRSRQLGVVEVKISLIESTRYFVTEIEETQLENSNRLVLRVLKNDPATDPNGQLGLIKIKITVNNGVNSIVQTVNFTLTETWQVVIENAEYNVMYAFELYDNFRGTSIVQSSVRHIFGATALANPPFEMTDGSLDFVYNVETKTITASKSINFLFIEAYLKDGKRVKINEDNQGPLDAIVPETTDPIKKITLFPSNEVDGAIKTYTITVEYHGDSAATVYTVYIFNKHAEAFLHDDAGNDKADLFRGSVTTDPVVATYVAGTEGLTGAAANLFETRIYYRFNNEAYQLLTKGTRFTQIGTYQYHFEILTGNKVLLTKAASFTISKEGISTFAIRVQRGSVYETLIPSGNYSYNGQLISEYVSNASVFRVDLNSNLFLQYTTLSSPTSGLTKGTYIIKISNKNSSQKPSIYFETTLAITLIEETQNILTNTQITSGSTTFSYYTSGIASSPVITSDIGSYRFITSTEENSSGVIITWPTWFGTQNNKVLLTLKQNGQTILMGDNSGLITLAESGQYVFSFNDIAGNTHYFTFRQSGAYVTSNEYTIHYLASVVFLVREEEAVEGHTGVQNAIYNSSVAISIPASTISIYYDVSARPEITVEKNGVEITVTKTDNEWVLTEPGLYKVSFSAKAKPTSSGATSSWLPEVPLYFTIVNPNESRWAFEFLEYEDYVITKLEKNGESILGNFRVNPNDSTEKVRSFVLSYFDRELSGKGRYDITIQNSAVSEFSFSLWINDGEIPIVVSVDEGTVTTNAVSVQFNMQNIFNNIGDCFVKISQLDAIYINAETLGTSTSEIMDISLTETGVYFIQVFTAGGSLMYSYRIEVKEPLNTISIILIVVGSLTVLTLTFVFFKLRKRMQVK